MQQPEAKYTLLIVDDDPDLLPSLVATVEALSDFTIITADNGVSGLERFFEMRPNCAIIDVRMPGIDGYQFVRAVRGDPTAATTPLIIMTALAQERDRFVGMASGVDHYLVKPVKPQALMLAIHHALHLSTRERQHRFSQLAESDLPQI